jgi:hypothetical protein
MKKNNKKTEYMTKFDLKEQTQIILTALDKRFISVDKRFDSVDKRFISVDKRFDSVDKTLDKVKDELKNDINNVQILIDGYVKAQEEFKEEFVILKEEVRQIKKLIKEKFGLEISAI